MDSQAILQSINEELHRLITVRALLKGEAPKKKRVVSAEGLSRMQIAQRARRERERESA